MTVMFVIQPTCTWHYICRTGFVLTLKTLFHLASTQLCMLLFVLFRAHKYLPWQNKYAACTQVTYQTYVLLVCEQMQANKRTYCTLTPRFSDSIQLKLKYYLSTIN